MKARAHKLLHFLNPRINLHDSSSSSIPFVEPDLFELEHYHTVKESESRVIITCPHWHDPDSHGTCNEANDPLACQIAKELFE